MGFITVDGENQIAAKQGAAQTLNIVSFVLANIDLLGAEPANRIEAMPVGGDIMATLPVTSSGYVNTNQIVYSLTMDSSLGDYDFNWIGLIDDEGVLVAVTYTPLIQKRKTAGAVPGNNLTRNFLIAYSGIQATTAIAVPAATWQIDFNTRLHGIDERERSSNYDLYGHDGFIGDGFSVVRQAATTTYDVVAGVGYVGGVRIASAISQEVVAAGPPTTIWLDVSLEGDISDVAPVVSFVVDATAQNDYVDGNGFDHYLTKLCEIAADGSVTDFRVELPTLDLINQKVSILSNKNAIINGGFDIWQRGTTQTTNGYLSDDRWFNESSGSTKVAEQQVFALGQIEVPNNPKYFSRTVVTSVAGIGSNVRKTQKIESVKSFAGQKATFSFWAKADSVKNIAMEIIQEFGTGGAPSALISGIESQLIALTTAWKKYEITVDIPSILGKVLGTDGNDNLSFRFFFEAGSNWDSRTASLGQQSGTFDIAQVQVEKGIVATDFEQRTIGEELALCYRYYYDFELSVEAYSSRALESYNTTLSYMTKYFSCPVMRTATPTIIRTVGASTNIDSTGLDYSKGRVSSVGRAVATGRFYVEFTDLMLDDEL